MLVTKFYIDKSKRCTTAWLNLRTLLSMQFFTYKVMSENSGLTHAKDCDACSLWKTSLYTTFWLTWMCSHETFLIDARVCIQFVAQFPMLCSTDMFPGSVSTTRRVHARVHTLKDGCLYTFWLTNSCPCVTLNISHLVCHIIFHRCTWNKVPHHDFLTYEPISLCNFWLTRTCPCANCHIWGRVCLQRVTKFLTFYLVHHVSTHCVDYESCSCACSRTKKTYVCTLFELERHVHA